MSISRRTLGIWGENKAVEYLVNQAYSIIKRNYRSSYGEIDIIAKKNGITVFIEVKTRSSKTYGLPEESISADKELRLIQTAEDYLVKHPQHEDEWRIDVISILKKSKGPPQIIHFKDAIHDK